MKRLILALVVFGLPFAAFAQTIPRQARETSFLKQQLGLSDIQVSQVLKIQETTFEAVRSDRVHIRLLQAEIAEALLPQSVDQAKVNNLIDQVGQTRANVEKSLVNARIQLRSIMGDRGFMTYMQLVRQRLNQRRFHQQRDRYGEHMRYAPRAPQASRISPNMGRFGVGPGDRLLAPFMGLNFGQGQ